MTVRNHEVDIYRTGTGRWEWDCPEQGVHSVISFTTEDEAYEDAVYVMGGWLYR